MGGGAEWHGLRHESHFAIHYRGGDPHSPVTPPEWLHIDYQSKGEGVLFAHSNQGKAVRFRESVPCYPPSPVAVRPHATRPDLVPGDRP